MMTELMESGRLIMAALCPYDTRLDSPANTKQRLHYRVVPNHKKIKKTRYLIYLI